MGALSTWTSWVTIIGVGLALRVIVWPRIQMWATRRVVFRLWASWPLTLLIPKFMMTRALRLQQSLIKRFVIPIQVRLTPLHYRASLVKLVDRVKGELKDNTLSGSYLPSPESDRDLIHLAAYVHYKNKRLKNKNLMRRHRGVRCAGGCKTRYGKKNKADNAIGGGGIANDGGWFCPSVSADGLSGSCIQKATGDHYCGKCFRERRETATRSDMESAEAGS